MIFDISTITNPGNSLLTRATSGSKILWTKCGCYQDSSSGPASTSLSRPVALGNAVATFEQGGGVTSISCSMTNASEGCQEGYAISFGLWAKIEGDQSDVLVVLAKATTSQPTFFPAYDGSVKTKLNAFIDLSVKISESALSSISVSLSQYALAANLQQEIDAREALSTQFNTLRDDVVTKTGEQAITGKKSFTNSEGIRANQLILREDVGSGNWGGAVKGEIVEIDEVFKGTQTSIYANAPDINGSAVVYARTVDENVLDENSFECGMRLFNTNTGTETASIKLNESRLISTVPIQASDFKGRVPYPTTRGGDIPVGGFAMIAFCKESQSEDISLKCGESFTLTAQKQNYHLADCTNGSWGSSVYPISAGTYMPLSDASSTSMSVYSFCLVMRIS